MFLAKPPFDNCAVIPCSGGASLVSGGTAQLHTAHDQSLQGHRTVRARQLVRPPAAACETARPYLGRGSACRRQCPYTMLLILSTGLGILILNKTCHLGSYLSNPCIDFLVRIESGYLRINLDLYLWIFIIKSDWPLGKLKFFSKHITSFWIVCFRAITIDPNQPLLAA